MPQGLCHLCLQYGDLTFEHVPPRAAFNKDRQVLLTMETLHDAQSLEDLKRSKGKVHQGGIGAFSLCRPCNNRTGGWYGDSYVEFARQGLEYLESGAQGGRIVLPFVLRPLAVLKQVVSMFLATMPPSFSEKHPYLRKFVLRKEETGMPTGYHFYAFLTRAIVGGSTGPVYRGNMSRGGGILFSVVTLRPLGFLMTVDGEWDRDPAFAEISYFAHWPPLCAYEPWKALRKVWLEIPVMGRATHPFFFTDYDNPPKQGTGDDLDIGPEALRHRVEDSVRRYGRLV